MLSDAATQTAGVTRFQGLIQAWIDAEPSRNPRDLARAGDIPASTVYAWLNKPLKQKPDDESITKLAHAIGVTESAIGYALAIDMGFLPDPGEDADLAALHRRLLEEN